MILAPPVLQLLKAMGMSSAKGREASVLMCLPSQSHSCRTQHSMQQTPVNQATALHDTAGPTCC